MISALIAFAINLVQTLGYPGIFLAMAIESGSIPLPSEAIMGIAGYLVYKGEMNLLLAGLAGALGNIAGSTVMYFIGLKGGRPIINKYGKYLHFDEEKFKKVDGWFEKWGDKIIFISQLLPVVRTFISLPGGILKINFKKFIFYTFTGAFIWCTLLAYVASLLGEEWEKIQDFIHEFEIFATLGFVVLVAGYVIYKVFKKRQAKIAAAAQA